VPAAKSLQTFGREGEQVINNARTWILGPKTNFQVDIEPNNTMRLDGESANYYGQQPAPLPNTYQTQPPQQSGAYYDNGPRYQPPPYPPQADQKLSLPPTFDEVFVIQKPKWNDLWAGLLFLATCAGFVVVSAISIQGYGMY
jgi:hypothetical protein